MKERIKLLIIAMLSAVILIFGGVSTGVTHASGELSGPLNFGFSDTYTLEEEVYFSDDQVAFIIIDEDDYITSSDVTGVTFTMTDPDGLDVENQADIAGYYFEYSKVGTYVLTAHITDGTDSTTKEYNISVGKSLDTSLLGSRYDMDVVSDTGLYQGLQDAFEDLYETQFGAPCNITGIYSDMFTLVDIEMLNLKGKGINSLGGIEELNFGTIKGIDLSNNSISKITKEQLCNKFATVTTLNLSNNEIEEIQLDNLTSLTSLNLSNNELKTLDISKLNIGEKTLELNLAHNKITTTDDIVIPKVETKFAHMNINLMSNYVGEPTKDYKENTRLSFTLGFQFHATPVIDTTTDDRVIVKHTENIYYYKTGVENLELRLYSITRDEDGAIIETHIRTIKESEMTEAVTSFTLNCGEYSYRYYIGNEEAYAAQDGRRHYKSEVFHSLPNSPEYYFEHNGHVYESLSKVTGYVTVHVKDYVSDENVTIYYKVNSGEWTEGTQVTVSSGKDTVYLKAVSDNGYESFATAVDVHTSLNPYVPDFVMLLVVIFLMIMIIFVLVPLLGKWINSDTKRR